MDLLDLARLAEKQKVAYETAANEAAISLAIDLVTHLVNETPVDTSLAESGWLATLHKPSEVRLHEPLVRGKHGSTAAASAKEAIRRAVDVIKRKKPNESLYIVNNTPYIGRLNAGSSSQAPPFYIEGVIAMIRVKQRAGVYNKGK